MHSEDIIEETVVIDRPWYSSVYVDDPVAIATFAAALVVGLEISRRSAGTRMSLLHKTVLAGASGMLCSVVYYFGFGGFWPEPLFYLVSGALFAAGVLFPYLKYDKTVWLRGIGLIALSALSYWSAIETTSRANSAMFTIDTKALVAGGLVGTIIVLTGARFIVPLNRFIPLAIVGFPAAIIGGLTFASILGKEGLFWASFVYLAWHSLMAIAVHISENWPWRTGEIK